MKHGLIFLILALTAAIPCKALSASTKRPMVVAVIDTGLETDAKPRLCNNGHRDLTGTGIADTLEHGTNISGIIDSYADGSYYCQVIIKYFNDKDSGGNVERTRLAFEHAIAIGADIINYSSYGNYPEPNEKAMIKKALDKGIIVVVPSGNQDVDLDKQCNAFPACYDNRLIVVGRTGDHPNCGHGSIVTRKENGTSVEGFGITMSGTSQATAVATGKIIAEKAKKGVYATHRSILTAIVQ